MPAQFLEGDILNADVDILVQQTNCVTRKPHGLSESIAKKWPCANIYGARKGSTSNVAFSTDEGIPGTCVIMKTGVTHPSRVACLMGQICPGNGKSDYWCRRYNKKFQDDNASMRKAYFQKALEDLVHQIKTETISNDQTRIIAFPFRVACGLAGGRWDIYEHMIHAFADDISQHGWKTHIYKLETSSQ